MFAWFVLGVVVLFVVYFVTVAVTSRVASDSDGFHFVTGAVFGKRSVSWPLVEVSVGRERLEVVPRVSILGVQTRVFRNGDTQVERRWFPWGYRLVLSDGAGPRVTVFAFDGKGVTREWERFGWPSIEA